MHATADPSVVVEWGRPHAEAAYPAAYWHLTLLLPAGAPINALSLLCHRCNRGRRRGRERRGRSVEAGRLDPKAAWLVEMAAAGSGGAGWCRTGDVVSAARGRWRPGEDGSGPVEAWSGRQPYSRRCGMVGGGGGSRIRRCGVGGGGVARTYSSMWERT